MSAIYWVTIPTLLNCLHLYGVLRIMRYDLLVPNCTAIIYLSSSSSSFYTARPEAPFTANNPCFSSRQSQTRRVTIAEDCHSSGSGDASKYQYDSAGTGRWGSFCIQYDKPPRMT